MVDCVVIATVYAPDGRPAAWCLMDVFEKHRFAWWEFETYVTSAKTGVDGKVQVTLVKGSTYRFRFRWLGKEKNERMYFTVCPWRMDVRF